MRIRKKKWAASELQDSKIYISNPSNIENWSSLFGNDNPISVDLGCGKGEFIAEYALLNPNKNFIAIDVKTDILAVAHRNILKTFSIKSTRPKNIVLIPYNIQYFDNLFSNSPIFSEIFINFPNPWYKDRHHKRRLTYPSQLKKYAVTLKDDGAIYFKTDDEEFFKDTVNYLEKENYNIVFSTDDYYSSISEELRFPASEHEKKFHSEGIPIHYLKATKQG